MNFSNAFSSTPAFGATTNSFGAKPGGAASGFGGATSGFGGAPSGFGGATGGFGGATTGFGKPTTGFGSPNTSAFGAKPTTGAPAFGTTSAPAFGAAPAASGFGSPTGAAPAFGAPAAPATGFGAFGAKPAQTSGFGSPTSMPAFGASTAFGAKPPAAPAFGATTLGFGGVTTPAANTFGAFGAAKPTSATGFGVAPSGFGGVGAVGFGQPATGFGQPAAGVTPGGFGNLAFGGGMNQALAAQQPMQPQLPPEEQQIVEAVERLKRSYAPARDVQGKLVNVPEGVRNDECAFKYIALKRKDGSAQSNQALLYGNLLEQAEKDNADPDNYFVVEELGIESLKRRFDQQNTELEKAKGQVGQIRDVIQEVNSSNQLLSSRVVLLKNRQLDLNRRMLAIMKKIEVIRCHGTPLQDTERRYYRKLVEMAQRLEGPLQVVQNMSISVALHEQPEEGTIGSISEEDLASFIMALKKQSDGLEMLTETLRKDLRDVDIIRQSFGGHL
jgi:predicted  nucleic acid-binding Zn-ribbon protein